MTDINSLESQLKEEFEMFSIAISRLDVMDKRKIYLIDYRIGPQRSLSDPVDTTSDVVEAVGV